MSREPAVFALADYALRCASETAERPDLAAIRAFNHRVVDDYHRISPLGGQMLLDIGASPHGFALERALGHGAALYVGIGLDVHTPVEVRADLRRGRLAYMDATELGFDAGTFDRVLTISTFEHVADPAQVLREMHRVLRPGGTALLSFEPVWTCAYGHHLHHFGAVSSAVPPWSHLYLSEEAMRAVLARRWPAEAPLEIDGALDWIYRSAEINRIGVSAQRAAIRSSDFHVEWLVDQREPASPASEAVAEHVSALVGLPKEDLLVKGLSAFLRK